MWAWLDDISPIDPGHLPVANVVFRLERNSIVVRTGQTRADDEVAWSGYGEGG